MSHQRWIWGIYCTQVIKHAREGIHPWALNPRVAITRSPKIGVSVAPQEGLMSSNKIFIKKKMKTSLHTCLISQLTDQVCMLLNRHVFRESPVAMSIRIKRLKAKPINSWNLRWKLCIQRSHSHVEWTIIVHAIGRSAYLPSATTLRRLCFYTCLSVHSGGVSTSVHAGIPPQYTPREQTPLPSRRLLLRTVHILLECILV